MTDSEKLYKHIVPQFVVKTVTTTITRYNAFGKKTDEDITTESQLLTYDGEKWVEGQGGDL